MTAELTAEQIVTNLLASNEIIKPTYVKPLEPIRGHDLGDYLLNNKSNKVFYILETNEWRSQKEEHPEIWLEFAKKYELDTYQGGRIPSLVYYNEGVKKRKEV